MKLIRILVYLLIFNSFILAGFLVSNYTGNAIVNSVEHVNLTRVVDGDTIETSMGKIRMLGINTPEKKSRGYQDPKDFLNQFVGKELELEKTKEDKDMYGRYLRYVFYDSRFLNKEILQNGWAHFYTYNEDKYTDELRKAEVKARNMAIGIWEKSDDECSSCIFLAKLNNVDPGEYVELGNKCSFNCDLNGWTIDDDSSSHTKKLNFFINSGIKKRIDYNGSVWNDARDTLYLRDDKGLLVIFYRY